MLGRGNENLRLPMVPISATTRHRLETILGELGLLHDDPRDNLRTF
jgi:4-hydroxy-tetrahydrodipicolinate synthase